MEQTKHLTYDRLEIEFEEDPKDVLIVASNMLVGNVFLGKIIYKYQYVNAADKAWDLKNDLMVSTKGYSTNIFSFSFSIFN